ncbi:MAG: hypothetical protein ACRDA5_01090 [Clostridium sp.]
MFGDKYKIDNHKINPRPEVINSLSEKMKYNIDNNKEVKVTSKNKFRYVLVAASFMFVFISVTGYFISSRYNKGGNLSNNELSVEEKKSENITGEEENQKEYSVNDKNDIVVTEDKSGFYVPNIEITKRDNSIQYCMISMVIYNGRVYVQSGIKVSIEDAKLLMDKKIGIAKDFSEFMDKSDTEIGGKIDLNKVDGLVGVGGQEIYKAKGYDEKFRLIAYVNDEYGERAEIYECLNGIRIRSGNDIFGKIKIAENIKLAKWDTFNNWNYGTQDFKNVAIDETINNFVKAMYESIPYSLENEEFKKQFYYKETDYYEEGQDKQKFLYLDLKDGTTVEIRLFSNGYIAYAGLNGYVFKVNENEFRDLWDKLQ